MDAYRDQYAQLFHGGKDVVLLAISTDSVGELASWAHDAKYPFRFASDSGGVVGRSYGAFSEKYQVDNRTLFVIAPDGKIAYRAAPFREIDPTAYTELAAGIAAAAGKPASAP
jgi:peroxiredoxin